jgi:Gig2-like
MSLEIKNLPDAIRSVKANLRKALPNYAELFREGETEMRRKVALIVKEREAGESVIPIVQYEEIASGAVSPEVVASIKERGACVIRNVYSVGQAETWDDEIGRYVEENHLDAKLAHAAEDKYFGTLASAKPQIYGIYWSRPQVQQGKASRSRARMHL